MVVVLAFLQAPDAVQTFEDSFAVFVRTYRTRSLGLLTFWMKWRRCRAESGQIHLRQPDSVLTHRLRDVCRT